MSVMLPSAQRSLAVAALLLALAGCTLPPFRSDEPARPPTTATSGTQPAGSGGAGPQVTTPPAPQPTEPVTEPPVEVLPPQPPPPRERPKAPPAQLGAASKALVSQAQAQRKRGDLPGATASLERALRIEPNNPLLWIEMGRLRMDQRNYPQAEAMGRKAISMAPGDTRTQSSAWQLIADSFRARGKNIQAQEALQKAQSLATL
jgi:hypothetical protein